MKGSSLGRVKTGWALLASGLSYLVQLGIVFLVVFHAFTSKDAVIIASLLLIVYGMTTAQIASESVVSGIHFVALANRLSHLARATSNRSTAMQTGDDEASLEELTERDRPYAFTGALFGLGLALIGAVKLVYTLLVS